MEGKFIDEENDVGCIETSKHSPIYHIKSTLMFLRTLSGFPILPTNSKWDSFEFIASKEYPRLIVILILFSIPINTLLYLFRNDLNALTSMITVSKLDYLIEIFTLFLLPFCFNLIYFINFKNNTSQLNKVCKLMSEINCRQDHYFGFTQIHVKAKKKVEIYMIIFLMMGCLIAALMVITGYVALEFRDGGTLPDNLKPVLAASLSSIILLGPISHIVSSGDFILIYLILHLIQNLVCLRSEVEKGKIERKNNPISTIHDVGSASSRKRSPGNEKSEMVNRINKLNIVLDIALDIGKVIENVNACFAGMLFCNYGGNLLIATCSFYFASNYLYISEFSPMNLSMGLMSIVGFILYMGRLYILTTSGHVLGQEMAKLNKGLKFYLSMYNRDSNIEQREKTMLHEKSEMVIESLDSNAPLSPYGYFSINGGSLLSALATIITYLIVLIQFKMSE